MAKGIVIEEFHITVLVPPKLPDSDREAVRQILNTPAFQQGLSATLRDFIATQATLHGVRIRLSR